MSRGPAILISVIVVTLSSLGVTSAARAQSSCGSPTTVAAGETLADVAERCDVTLDALMEANPDLSAEEVAPGVEVDMPGVVRSDWLNRAREALREAGEEIEGAARNVGRSVTDYLSDNPDLNRDILEFSERLGLPGAGPSAGADVVVSPSSGGIGDEVTVSASGLRGDAKVAIGAGPPEGDYKVLTETTTNTAGRAEASIVIPGWAKGEDTLIFVVESERVSVVSEPFQITGE